jgi:hypothetical protein
MMLFGFFTFVCLFGYLKCDTCDFNPYQDCVKEVYKQQFQQGQQGQQKPAGQPGADQFDQRVKDCFKNSGCKEPNFSDKTNDDSNQGNQVPPQNSDLEKRRECFGKNNQKAKGLVEKCVQKTVPNFHFPDDKGQNGRSGGGGSHENGHDRPIGGIRGGMGNMGRRINESCPDSTSRDKVGTCLKGLWETPDNSHGSTANDHDQRRKEAEDRFKQMCAKKATCFSKLTPQCQKQYNDSKSAVCNCAQSELRQNSVQFDRELDTCTGDPKPAQSTSTTNGQKKSSVEMIIKRMCQNKDMCEKGFPSESQSGPKRPPLKGHGGTGRS